MEEPQEDLLIGRTIDDRYEIERRVGQWSMGLIYQAKHLVLERPVELNLLRAELCQDVDLIEDFMNEARAVSKLDHPAVLGVFDSGWIDEDSFFYVSECVEAENFQTLVGKHGRLPWRRVRTLAIQLCDALGGCHRHEILHRALEPANILVGHEDEQDVVKLRNFGTAKIVDAFRHSPPIFSGDQSVFGAPHYMAPEQAQGLSASVRTDVYGAAACIYELLTGKPPVEGESFQQVVSRILTRRPAPATELAPDNVPTAVDEVLRKGLSRIPDARYQTIEAFGAAILALPPSLQPKAPPSATAGAPDEEVDDAKTPVVDADEESNKLRSTLIAVGPGPSPKPKPKPKNRLRTTMVAPETGSGRSNTLRQTQIAPSGQFMGFQVPAAPRPVESPPRPLATPRVTLQPEPSIAAPVAASRTPWIVAAVLAAGLMIVVAILAVGSRGTKEPAQPVAARPDESPAPASVAAPVPQPDAVDAAPPTKREAPPPVDPATLPKALSGPDISSGFKSARSGIEERCGRHPGTKVEIVATIAGTGTVKSAEPAPGSDSALARCVTEAVVETAVFAQFSQSADTFRWTYRL